MTRDGTLLAYFGHHKCGTRWVLGIVREVCNELGLRTEEVHNAAVVGNDLAGLVQRQRIDLLAYTNADFARAASLPAWRGFHIVRDPRDIVVSAYFSHLHSHPLRDDWPELAEIRRRLQSLDRDQGLLAQIDLCADQFRCLAEWPYDRDDVLELRMEDLTARPYEGFLEILRFLELLDESPFRAPGRARHLLGIALRRLGVRGPASRGRLPAERLLGIVHENDFARRSGGRSPGSEDPHSHYRKGVAGDWVNHFGPGHVAAFKERYNALLLRLGYETDADWRPPDP